jgi:hypothetical protein
MGKKELEGIVSLRYNTKKKAKRPKAMKKVSLEKAKQEYAGQWLAFLVTEEMPTGELLGKVIAHNPDRRELHKELREKKVGRAYVTFAGPVVKPGYAVIL